MKCTSQDPHVLNNLCKQKLEPAPPSLKALLYSLLTLLSVSFQTHGGAHVQVGKSISDLVICVNVFVDIYMCVGGWVLVCSTPC